MCESERFGQKNISNQDSLRLDFSKLTLENAISRLPSQELVFKSINPKWFLNWINSTQLAVRPTKLATIQDTQQ